MGFLRKQGASTSPQEREWLARVISACHEHPDLALPELGQLLAMDKQKASPEAKWFAMRMVAMRLVPLASVQEDEFDAFCDWLARDIRSITKAVRSGLAEQ